MGCITGQLNCQTNEDAIAPNPSPDKWTLLDLFQYDGAHVLVVQYEGCTNYEGKKVMVYSGRYHPVARLDPHFNQWLKSPIARFPPTDRGIYMACALARSYPQYGMDLRA